MTQKKRTAEEILYDYNAENMDETIYSPIGSPTLRRRKDSNNNLQKHKSINYRKRELVLSRCFRGFFYFEILCFIVSISI